MRSRQCCSVISAVAIALALADAARADDTGIEPIPSSQEEIADAVLPPDWRSYEPTPHERTKASGVLEDLTAPVDEIERVERGVAATADAFSEVTDHDAAEGAVTYGSEMDAAGESLEAAADLLGHVFDDTPDERR